MCYIHMKQIYGKSDTGNLKEAVRGIASPKLLILFSNPDQFESHVAELEQMFPGVPSIGCIAMGYDKKVVEKGVTVTAFTQGVTAIANVMEQVSVMPAKYIGRLEEDIRTIHPGNENTVVIDLCAGNDACVLTTMHRVLQKNRVSLMGGTGDAGKISVNGRVYEDAVGYALVKNEGGKVKVYKENIYRPIENSRFVASKTDRSKYYIGELNGRPAKQVYMDELHIAEKDIGTQTFKNPFGKIVGDDVCIVSIKEVVGSGLACFRQVNDSDVLSLLELVDYKQIAQETIEKIKGDFPRISAVFSVNCLFRYLLFSENGILDDYLSTMTALGDHCGFMGYGEHYNNQFVNQSMTCVVFE